MLKCGKAIERKKKYHVSRIGPNIILYLFQKLQKLPINIIG